MPSISLSIPRCTNTTRKKVGISVGIFTMLMKPHGNNEKDGWKHRHAKTIMDSLEKDVFPYLGTRNLSAIRPSELLTVIRRIEKREAYRVAEKVLQRTRSVFRYGIQTGRANHNPATELQGVIKTQKVQHRAALEISELALFIQTVKNYAGLPSTRYAYS